MIYKVPEYLIQTYSPSPANIIVTDSKQKILWANESLSSFLRELESDVAVPVGASLTEFLRGYLHEDELILFEIHEGVAELPEESCFSYEFPLYTYNKAFWMMMTACRHIFDGNRYTIINIYDISKQHQQRKLKNKQDDNEIVRQIITESMHTWRQPLNSISLFTQDIKDQFNEKTLTQYYMNFASRQIFNEIKRLSDSIDEMAEFYKNNSDEDLINVAEVMFRSIDQVDRVLSETNTNIQLNCHALGDTATEAYADITDHFRIRCGTGTKKCFHGCNKGNLVITGDKSLYEYIIRHLITLGTRDKEDRAKSIQFEHLIEDDSLKVAIHYKSPKSEILKDLDILANLFRSNFNGEISAVNTDEDLLVTISFNDYKAKSPI